MKQIPPLCVEHSELMLLLYWSLQVHTSSKQYGSTCSTRGSLLGQQLVLLPTVVKPYRQLRDYCALVLLQTLGVKQLVAASRACAPIG